MSKEVRDAANAAKDLESSENSIAAVMQRQTDYATQLSDRLKDQLAASQAKLTGDESSLTLNKEIEEIQRNTSKLIEDVQKTTEAGEQKINQAYKTGNATLQQRTQVCQKLNADQAAAIAKIQAGAASEIKDAQTKNAQIQANNQKYTDGKKIIDQITHSTETLAQKTADVANAWKKGSVSIAQADEALQKLQADTARTAAKEQEESKSILDGLRDQVKEVQAKMNGETKMNTLMQLQERINKMQTVDKQALLAEVTKEYNQLQQINEEYEKQQNAIEQVLKKHELQRQKLQQLQDLLNQNVITENEYDQACQKVTEEQTKQVNLSSQISSIMNQAFELMTAGAKNFGKQLDNLIKKMVEMIAKALILATLMAVIDPIGAGAGASFMTSLTGSLSKMVGGSLMGFASGGRPPVGMPSLVGENGPEIFVPDTAGTIVPHNAINSNSSRSGLGALGGQGQQINLQVVQKIPANVSAQMQVGPSGEQLLQVYIDRAITNATRSGGQLFQWLMQNGLQPQAVTR